MKPRFEATYVDTSVWCACCLNQPDSAGVMGWLEQADLSRLGAAWWAETEFCAALGIQLRTKALTARQARAARERFADLMSMVNRFNMIEPDFSYAAGLCLQPGSRLRGGAALHLAVAQRHGCKVLATLDADMQVAARHCGLKLVEWI